MGKNAAAKFLQISASSAQVRTILLAEGELNLSNFLGEIWLQKSIAF
jgi:hypothetical protein